MPFGVNCPVCGADGTSKANEILRRVLPPPVPAGASQPPGPPAAAAPPRARITMPNRPAAGSPPPRHSPQNQTESGVASPPHTPAPMGVLVDDIPPSPSRAPSRARYQLSSPPAGTSPAKPPHFGLGVLGALVGTLVGAGVYFLIFHYTGLRFKLLAIGVGYLSGLGAELLGRKEGSKELGFLAAGFALAGIVGAQYFVAKAWWKSDSGGPPSTYEAAVAEARTVTTAIPTGSDQEIRLYLAREYAEPDEKPDPAAVTVEDIQDFRENTFGQMRDLAGGKITREAWEQQQQAEKAKAAEEEILSDEDTFKTAFLLLLLSKLNLVSMAAAAGLAYKVCANA